MRHQLGVALLLLVAPLAPVWAAGDTWIPLDGSEQYAPASVQTRLAAEGAVELSIAIPGVVRSEVETKDGQFHRLSVVDAGTQGEIGHPELPALRLLIAIPYGGDPVLEVLRERKMVLACEELGITAPIMPVQAPVEKVPGAMERAPFVLDQATYGTDSFQLDATVSLGEAGVIRGHRFVELTVSPVDINPVTADARIMISCTVRVSVRDPDPILTMARAERYRSREFDLLARRLLVGGSPDTRDLNGMPDPPLLLVIAGASWVNDANLLNYVAWKTDKGFRPVLVSTSQTGTTNSSILSYIQNAYGTWPIPPTYVLLVGDTNVIPHWVGIGADSPATDLNYTMLEGSDYFPDVDLGRWSVADATDLANIVSKTVSYEQVGWSGNNTWEKYAVFMASEDNYSITEGTHNYVHTTYLQPDGYSGDKLYCHTYSATPQQVRDAHNAGRSLSIYSGHGAETYWADGPVFYQSDVNNLTNTVYPFVQSYACLTGKYSNAECFSETWIRASHGAIGMMASSVTSYWTEDDILERRVMEGFCANVNAGEENQTWTAGMMNYGKLRYYAYFGAVSTTRRYFEMYNIMGDPSIDLWTAVPAAMAITHDASLAVGATSFDVNVSNVGDWVVVCAHDENDEVYASEYLFANGTASLDLGAGASSAGTLHITVTGHDRVPYQTTIPITAGSGPYIVYAGSTILGDGQADVGETVLVEVELENVGNETAYGVQATLSTVNGQITVTEPTQGYGDIGAGATAQPAAPFQFFVGVLPDGAVVPFDVGITSGTESWEGSFDVTVHAAPEIVVTPGSLEVWGGVGETEERVITVGNSGTADLTYTVGVTVGSRGQTGVRHLELEKGEVDPRAGEVPERGSGGPDGYGYRWVDSDEPGGPAYSWVDISSSGASPGSGDDSNYGPFSLGFTFPFYGTGYDQVRICTNGWLSFTSTGNEWTNQGIPGSSEPNGLIAPFWDDFDLSDGGSLQYLSEGGGGRFIVQWTNVPRYQYPSGTGSYTFEVILHADGRIVYQYNNLVGDVNSCTVGIEDEGGGDGLQVVFNGVYLHNGLAIQFSAQEPWLTVSPTGGTVVPGGDVFLTATLDASDLSEGVYTGTITITSNDADEGSIGIPVTFHVGAMAPPELTVEEQGSSVELTWTAVGAATAYWVYGASNNVWFVPGPGPGYANRLTVLPPGTTSWSSTAGLGDPDSNWTYLVLAVDGSGIELCRSNRAGECDFALP